MEEEREENEEMEDEKVSSESEDVPKKRITMSKAPMAIPFGAQTFNFK